MNGPGDSRVPASQHLLGEHYYMRRISCSRSAVARARSWFPSRLPNGRLCEGIKICQVKQQNKVDTRRRVYKRVDGEVGKDWRGLFDDVKLTLKRGADDALVGRAQQTPSHVGHSSIMRAAPSRTSDTTQYMRSCSYLLTSIYI
jgi:hypothetical protein